MLVISIARLIMVLIGVGLFLMTLSSLARRKMTESFCLTWGVVAVVIILAGILIRPYGISGWISPTTLLLMVIIGMCLIFGAFYITGRVSELERKNQELAIQVSLLNQENRMILDKLEELTQETGAE